MQPPSLTLRLIVVHAQLFQRELAMFLPSGKMIRRLTLLIRRLVVLLVIGAAHLFLLWNGDILVEYAVAGLTVLPFLFGPRWLAFLAAATALGPFSHDAATAVRRAVSVSTVDPRSY